VCADLGLGLGLTVSLSVGVGRNVKVHERVGFNADKDVDTEWNGMMIYGRS